MKIIFLGGTEEVTGSRYLIESKDQKILVDCGLFQGDELGKRNWNAFEVEPSSIDAIVLTHAHIDHTGYIPRLVKDGFKGKVYCSKATYALCSILFLDSAFLFEEDAKYSSTDPLYTKIDAEHALKLFQTVDYNKDLNLGPLIITLIASFHILGSSFVVISDGKKTITFSGDLGPFKRLVMKSPPYLKTTDFLVLESTYGDRLHEHGDSIKELGKIINETVAKGGVLIIPAFAVGRSQTILYSLYQLKQNKMIPNVPIFLDSPMAINVTDLFCEFKGEHKLPPHLCQEIFDVATYTRRVEESKHIDQIKYPAIIIAGSGMANGGRVLHHFRHFISDAKNTILFVGYQAEGTNGRALIEGAKKINIYDKTYNVHAEIKVIDTFSAHADYNEILQWLGGFESLPKKVFITHGELESALSLKKKIEERFGLSVVIPKYLQTFDLK